MLNPDVKQEFWGRIRPACNPRSPKPPIRALNPNTGLGFEV